MAASAPSPLVSSTEKTNGAKLSRLLIDGGTTVLKMVFDSHHSPANLAMDLTANYPKLCNLLKRRVLHRPQWDKLFPPSGSTPDSNNFDITLLFLLLTEICGLSPPPSGWHKKPPLSDTTLEANLARIKFFRNELYGHVSTTGIDSSTFSHLWREISDVLVALGLNKADVDRLKAEYCGEEDYLQMLCEWADSEKDLKSQLKEINQTIDMVHQNQTQGAEMLQQMKSELHGACHTQTKIQEEVLEVKKSIEDFNQRGQANRTEEILNVLAKFEFNGEIEFHVSRFQEGTREWIFKKIEGWLDDRSSPNRVMVISGNAGVGKSVISAVTCKRMQQAGRLLGSHFFQYNNSRYRNPQLMLQSLASHLCRALPEYKEALFDQLSRNLGIEINSMGVKELFALLFKEPLSKITDPRRNLLLVIDALDESEYKGRNELLDVIANHFIKLPQWIRFLVTTRPEVDISNSLSDLQPLYLETNDDDNRRDIRLFLEKQLDQDVKDGRVPEATSHSKAPEEEKSLEVEEFSSRSTDQDGRQQEEAARNVDERKTVIKRGKIADESETWNLAKAGASITFNLGAITKSLTITCSLWSPTTLSPPIGSNELLVSNVIELSHDGPPDLEFMENASGSINVALLHSASNFKGYEVVIKQLVDPQYNEWEDLETKNIWHSSVHPTVPNWTCPSVETSCSKRWFSSFAAVWRLKSFVFPKPMSKTSEFICSLPDYPNVSVAIPWNSLPADTDFSLTLKVQEVPTIDHDVEGMFIGPILHISCSNNVKLSAPAKISLPLALTDGEIEPAELHSGQVKILHFNSREESQDWTDITDHLDMPVVLRDGIVTFQVKTFCKFWLWLLKTSTSIPWKLVRILLRGFMPEHVGFLACLCDDAVSSRYLLKMFCFPQHLGSGLNSDISSRYSVNMQGEGTSQKPLSCGDETYVSLSNGFEVHGKGNVEDIVLKFLGHDPFEQNLRVIIKDPGDLQVDFLKLLGDKERKNSRIICQVPIIPRSPVQHPAPVTFDFEKRIGISAQSVKHSIAKQPTVESSSCSPVAAPKKRKRQSTDLVKAGGPSNDKLEGLSQQLGEKWEELGRRLGFNQAAIENFDRDKRGLAKKAFKMLLTWKQKEGSKATNKVLYNALRHKFVKRSDLAEEFCCRKRS